MTCAASCRASRVLPLPPGPVRVSRRLRSRCPFKSRSSCSRPMKLVSWRGRLSGIPSSTPTEGMRLLSHRTGSLDSPRAAAGGPHRCADGVRTTHVRRTTPHCLAVSRRYGRGPLTGMAERPRSLSYPPRPLLGCRSQAEPRCPGPRAGCNLTANWGRHHGHNLAHREATMSSSPVIEKFLFAIESASIPACDVWSADATLDATVPNWRFHAAGADAIRAEYARASPACGCTPRPSPPDSRPPPNWCRGGWAWPISPRSCARWTHRAETRSAVPRSVPWQAPDRWSSPWWCLRPAKQQGFGPFAFPSSRVTSRWRPAAPGVTVTTAGRHS